MRALWRACAALSAIGGIVLLVMVIGGVLLLLTVKVKYHNGPAQFQAELQKLHTEGAPITPAELQRPLPPAGQNAAPDYVHLMTLLKAHPIDPNAAALIADLGQNGPSSAGDEAAVRQALAARPDVMDLIHRAAQKPDCVFRRDWSLGPALLLPEFASMREAARILHAESYELAKAGRYDEAIQTQALGFRVAQHAGSDPTLISYLVGVACDAIALNGMQQILQMAGNNLEVDRQVAEAVQLNHPHLDLHHAYEGEIMMAIDCREIMRRQGMAAFLHDVSSEPLPMQPGYRLLFDNELADANIANVLRLEQQVWEAAALPEDQQRQAIQAVDSEVQRELAQTPRYEPSMILARILLPVYAQVATKADLIRARERATVAGAEVLAYRAEHGHLPVSLQGAMPQPPQDPFGSGPLQYRTEGNGFVVYSVGPEGRFDGGYPGMKRDGNQAYFRYTA